jgi:hypothetical protein
MSKTSFTASAVNLARMERCREIARAMGFLSPQGPDAPMVHSSNLVVLAVTDPEGSWRVSLRARRAMTVGNETYVIETGSMELSNLSEAQFRCILVGVLTSLGVW